MAYPALTFDAGSHHNFRAKVAQSENISSWNSLAIYEDEDHGVTYSVKFFIFYAKIPCFDY